MKRRYRRPAGIVVLRRGRGPLDDEEHVGDENEGNDDDEPAPAKRTSHD